MVTAVYQVNSSSVRGRRGSCKSKRWKGRLKGAVRGILSGYIPISYSVGPVVKWLPSNAATVGTGVRIPPW